jgi:glycosyltransferase involved in cell wall biosynthesis
MNILHIITGLGGGGAAAVLYRLCRTDTQHRHSVISLLDEGKYGPLLREVGVSVQCLEMPRGRVTLRGLLRLWRLLRQERPDVVQTWMYHADLVGGVLARLAGNRAVCWGIRHTNLEPDKSRRSTILVARLCARLSKWVPRRIVCCAHKAAEVHGAFGYDAKKLVVIPNGYELSVFQPNPEDRQRLRQEWSVVPTSLPLIGMVGRFDPQKDLAGLIAALERVAAAGVDFRCILVGPGMEESNADLRCWIESAGLTERIHLLGLRNDIPAVMNALDLHVLSSFGEGFPNVLAEAMACGTPCVTTDVGDAALIVGDTGWVVPPSQPEALADAIIRALRTHQEQAAWSARCAAARSRIQENFSVETMAQAYGHVWEIASDPPDRKVGN